MTKTIETTAAKIGRSMKKWEMRMGGSAVSIGTGPEELGEPMPTSMLGSLRRHLDARARPHQAVDDDAVVGLEAGGDDAQTIDDRTRA